MNNKLGLDEERNRLKEIISEQEKSLKEKEKSLHAKEKRIRILEEYILSLQQKQFGSSSFMSKYLNSWYCMRMKPACKC